MCVEVDEPEMAIAMDWVENKIGTSLESKTIYTVQEQEVHSYIKSVASPNQLYVKRLMNTWFN